MRKMRTQPMAVTPILVLAFAAACDEEPAAEPEAREPAPLAEEAPEAQEAHPQAAAGGPAAEIPDEAYGTYDIDPVHSMVVFSAGHFGVGYVYGMFNDVKGTFDMAEDPAESSVKLEIAAESIFSGSRQRDDDLKGPDFLNVGQFPQITFESSEVRRTPTGYEVDGSLTLRGQTRPVTIEMEHAGSGTVPMDNSYRTGFRGKVEIDRNQFGIEAMPEAVGQELELIPAIEGIRQ
jgi:polyisoprenoid-binding protein YceI